jgi:hypothetical protein
MTPRYASQLRPGNSFTTGINSTTLFPITLGNPRARPWTRLFRPFGPMQEVPPTHPANCVVVEDPPPTRAPVVLWWKNLHLPIRPLGCCGIRKQGKDAKLFAGDLFCPMVTTNAWNLFECPRHYLLGTGHCTRGRRIPNGHCIHSRRTPKEFYSTAQDSSSWGVFGWELPMSCNLG